MFTEHIMNDFINLWGSSSRDGIEYDVTTPMVKFK